MHINAIEELDRVLGEIEAKIQYIESSPNRVFVLVEYETLSSFHWFNLCFKQFWDEFDHHSASQLLQYQEITKRYSELTGRYVKLFREQIDYLEDVIDLENKCVKELPPVVFSEDNCTDVIGYYKELCENDKDEDGNPIYEIDLDSDTHCESVNGETVPIDFHMFRSDKINAIHYEGLMGMHKCLNSIFDLMCAVCSYPDDLIYNYKPTQNETLKALEMELRKYAREVGRNVERDLKKIAQTLKPSRNASLTPDVWGQVMDVEDELFDLAISGELLGNKDKRFEHLDETQRKLWIDNFPLLQKIKTTCLDGELFDIRLAIETHNLLSSINADNLDLFYELVLRRNIIQCEMFPELKAQHEEWLKGTEEQEDDSSAEKQKRQNLFALKKNLKELLRENWFNEARSNVKYDATWTDGFVDALIASEYGEEIANIWYDDGRHGKCNYVRGYIIGLLKDNGVLSGKYGELATKVKIDRKYLGEGKKQPYADWVKAYVAGQF